MTIFERALEFVVEGTTIGLGSGRAATAFLKALGERVRKKFQVRGVATSDNSAALARQLGIPLVSLEEGMPLALTVDGADEVDPHLNLIKGYGRALVRAKIVAAASQQVVILVGPGKTVGMLGEKGRLPVEIVPFALPLCRQRLEKLGCQPVLDTCAGQPFVSDNGNYILDCGISPIADAQDLDPKLRAIPGVVGTGLFLGIANQVLIGDENFHLIEERQRS